MLFEYLHKIIATFSSLQSKLFIFNFWDLYLVYILMQKYHLHCHELFRQSSIRLFFIHSFICKIESYIDVKLVNKMYFCWRNEYLFCFVPFFFSFVCKVLMIWRRDNDVNDVFERLIIVAICCLLLLLGVGCCRRYAIVRIPDWMKKYSFASVGLRMHV